MFELLPTATRYRSWFPGMPERIAVMNQTLEAMVRDIDKPNVRYFRVSELVRKYADDDIDTATPDGFHYSVELHRRVGEALAREIDDWAQTQAHLRLER